MLLAVLLAAVAVQGLRLQGQAERVRQDAAALAGVVSDAAAEQPAAPAVEQSGGPAAELPSRLATRLEALQAGTAAMRDTTTSLAWRSGTRLPGLGDSLAAVAALAQAGDDVAVSVLPALTGTAADVVQRPRRGPLDLSGLTGRRQELRAAADALAAVRADVARLDVVNPRVREAHAEVTDRLQQLDAVVGPVAGMAELAGPMTGEQGVRRYLVVVQSRGEGRATGGLVGGFAELEVSSGEVRIVRTGSNQDLANRDADVVRVEGGFAETWGDYGAQATWFSSNLSLDFPAVAQVWAALYERQYDVALDGAVGLTPDALDRLLAVAGPVTLPDGEQLAAGQAARMLEIELYRRFPAFADEPARNAYQLQLMQSVLPALLGGASLTPDGLRQLQAAAAEGSLRLASFHQVEQEWLARSSVAGALPGEGPFVAWTTNNIAGNKLDVYLQRTLTHRRQPLPGGRERVVATAELRNDAPTSGLPSYVTHRTDLGGEVSPTAPLGSNKLLVGTYLSPGAEVTSVTVDGEPVPWRRGGERGHPLVLVEAALQPAGGTAQVVVAAEQRATAGAVATLRQPVVRPDVVDLG